MSVLSDFDDVLIFWIDMYYTGSLLGNLNESEVLPQMVVWKTTCMSTEAKYSYQQLKKSEQILQRLLPCET